MKKTTTLRATAPALCLHCRVRPATPDTSLLRLWCAGFDYKTTQERPALLGPMPETPEEMTRDDRIRHERFKELARRGLRFCDKCREGAGRFAPPPFGRPPDGTPGATVGVGAPGDLQLVLVLALAAGLDPVEVLMRETGAERKRLKRKGLAAPGLRVKEMRESLLDYRAALVVHASRGPDAESTADEVLRTGKLPGAIRARRHRAYKRLERWREP